MVEQGNNIHFFQGTKEDLDRNIDKMIVGDLAIATDEMQWYMVKQQIVDNAKVLVLIGYQPPEETETPEPEENEDE